MNPKLRKDNCKIGLDYERKYIMCCPADGEDVVLTVPVLYAWHVYNLTTEKGIREWIILENSGWANGEMVLRIKSGYKIVFYKCRRVYLYGIILSENDGESIFGFEKNKNLQLRGSPFYSHRKQVFLSHSSADKNYVRSLAKDLERTMDVFFDEKSIAPGMSIVKSLNDGLSACDVLILAISSQSISSEWVLKEYAYAIHAKKLVIPILLDVCDIPPVLRDIKYIECFNSDVDVIDSIVNAIDLLTKKDDLTNR